jgi:hypothetical protein
LLVFGGGFSLTSDLYQYPLAAAAIEFTVEDLLPWAKV